MIAETLERYDAAIKELEEQIAAPVDVYESRTPQQNYNRRKKLESGAELTKNTAVLEDILKDLKKEKEYVIQGIRLMADIVLNHPDKMFAEIEEFKRCTEKE